MQYKLLLVVWLIAYNLLSKSTDHFRNLGAQAMAIHLGVFWFQIYDNSSRNIDKIYDKTSRT